MASAIIMPIMVVALSVITQATGDNVAGAQEIKQKAISLREVAKDPHSAEAMTLFGSTWLRGFAFIEDEGGKDCVLLTYVEPDRPTLHLDDLAVAYNNVTESRQRPACTINPRPETLRKLSELGQRLMGAGEFTGMGPQIQEWKRVARSPQDVIVYGVSSDTHFAKIMVEADYDLKNVVNGTEKMEKVTALTKRFLKKAETQVKTTGALSMPLRVYNRFWFNPGQPGLYRTDDSGTVILGKCPVVLRTEEEAVTPQGKLNGMSRPHPLAQKFADEFTGHYKDVARSKPVFRELESLYRFVAIADLLAQVGKEFGATEVVDNLVHRIQIRLYANDSTLPGRPSVDKLQGTVTTGNRVMEYQLILPACGGVSIDLHIDRTRHRVAEPRGIVSDVRQAVLAGRPSPKALWWYFQSDSLLRLAERSTRSGSAVIPSAENGHLTAAVSH